MTAEHIIIAVGGILISGQGWIVGILWKMNTRLTRVETICEECLESVNGKNSTTQG